MVTEAPNLPELHRERDDCWHQIGVFGDGAEQAEQMLDAYRRRFGHLEESV